MLDRHAAEALFLKHLDWIDKVASMACANHGVWGDDTEDFTGWVRMKLLEDDYAVLRRFRGDAEPKTYLASVVVRHFFTYYRAERGRWRPSVAAERMGAPAVDVETLVVRDGLTVAQAGEILRTSGRTTLSDIELARLLAKLPKRGPLRPEVREPETGMDATAGAWRADAGVDAAEAASRRAQVIKALGAALEQLEPEEKLIMQLHYGQGFSVADVARTLKLEQKPLYRRIERLRIRLRALLESAGLGGDDVRGLLDFDAP